jgi:hypothetical protein
MTPTVRDSTQFVKDLRHETATNPNVMYLSASFNVMLTKDGFTAPALPIKDLLVLYQESITKTKRNGEPSDYGKTFVRVGLPTSLIDLIVKSMNEHGIHVENPPIKSSTTVMVGKVPHTIFAANISNNSNANVEVGYGESQSDGSVVFKRLDDLVTPLSKGRDLEAHSTVAVKAKYSGSPPSSGDWKSVKYHLSLEPRMISLTDGISDEPIAPNITGGADPKAANSLPKNSAVSNEFRDYYLS